MRLGVIDFSEKHANIGTVVWATVGTYRADQLVFVDESSINQQTTYHGHAWSIRGTKAQCKAFFVCGRQQVNH